MTSVFTIERTTTLAFRSADGELPTRFLGHDNDGRLGWVNGVKLANTYASKGDAKSFKTHRLGGNAEAQIVRHTIH